MNFKKIVFILTMASSLSAQANQEEVATTGIGVADTKMKACEIALDHARREAAQSATTLVQATFTSVESDRGSSYQDDQVVTSKAFAKLLDKSEKASFDEGTGQIRCEVSAKFKAGFVTDNQENTDSSPQFTETSTQSIGEFKAGEPFCSKIMSTCFREMYSKQLGGFGIQVLPNKETRSKYYSSDSLVSNEFNMFFNEIAKSGGEINYIEITTKESLLSFIKKSYDELKKTNSRTSILIFYIKSHKWMKKKGFLPEERQVFASRKSGGDSIFSRPKVSPEYLEALDKEMIETQIALDGMY